MVEQANQNQVFDQTEKVQQNRNKHPKIRPFDVAITALLCINIGISGASLYIKKTDVKSPEILAKESYQLTNYYREEGKKNFSIENEIVSKPSSSYDSKKIRGTLKNKSKKNYDNVSVEYILYKDGVYIGSASDYISFVPAGAEIDIEATAYGIDDFDEFSLAYISAHE